MDTSWMPFLITNEKTCVEGGGLDDAIYFKFPLSIFKFDSTILGTILTLKNKF